MSTETKYKPHPAADLFPMMPGDQFEAFLEDIRKNGFQESITLYKNQILDGRNRYRAAVELNMLDDLPISEIDDDYQFDPFQWVVSRNLHRRHLNESQRAKIAAKLAKLKHGGDRKSDEIKGQICPSIKQAAEMLQVSPSSVKNAKVVEEHGSPELNQAVERGEVAVSKAAKIAKEVPKEKQVESAKEKSPKKKEPRKKQDYGIDLPVYLQQKIGQIEGIMELLAEVPADGWKLQEKNDPVLVERFVAVCDGLAAFAANIRKKAKDSAP